MTNTNIRNSKIQIENLYKSIFSDLPFTSIKFEENSVIIKHNDENNSDPATLEIIESNSEYKLSYWDGYSVAETLKHSDLKKILKTFKNKAKKMAKNLRRFSH